MTEPITDPSWIDLITPPHGTVTGQFVAVSYDSADTDQSPDVQPFTGRVILTPTTPMGRIDAALAHIRPVTVRIFGGQVVDDEDVPGVRILATDAEIGVEDWAWTARIELDGGPRLNPVTFKLPTDETVSLSTGIVPVESAPYQIVQGLPGRGIDGVAAGAGGLVVTYSDGTTETVSIDATRTATTGENANNWRTDETIVIPSDTVAISTVNRPADGRMGTVRVTVVAGIVSQLWTEVYRTASAGKPRILFRASNAIGPLAFSEWTDLTASSGGGQSRTATTGENANNWTTPETIVIPSDTIAISTLNRPTDGRMGTVQVTVVGGIVSQLWTEVYRTASAGKPRILHRATNALSPRTLSDWTDLTGKDIRDDLATLTGRVTYLEDNPGSGSGSGVIDDPGLRHQMLQAQFRRRRGGTIGTSGRVPVALRFDHGFAKFQPILDLLRTYQLPATQACFAHQFDAEGSQSSLNAGWTFPMIQTAGLRDGIEVANHSSTHYDATTIPKLVDEIAQSKTDLQAALPRLAVEGWITPGVGGTGYMDGWNTTSDLGKWATTNAGKLVLGHHAWAEGYTPGELHTLDGTILPGRHSWTIDLMDRAAQVEALIARAQRTGTGINFMLHPANVGNADMVDLARLEAIFAYLAAERTAGRIEVLTLGGWMMADTRSSYRLDLAPPLTSWTLGTATVNSSTGVATITGAQITATIPLANIEQYKGGIFEYSVELQSTGSGTSTITVTDDSGAVSATRTVPHVTPWQTVRQAFTIPRTGTTSITIAISRTGGSLQVRAPKVQPI